MSNERQKLKTKNRRKIIIMTVNGSPQQVMGLGSHTNGRLVHGSGVWRLRLE